MAKKKVPSSKTLEVPMQVDFIDERVLQEVVTPPITQPPPVQMEVVQEIGQSIPTVKIVPTAAGETGNAPLTRPTQRDEAKWQQ